MLCNNDLIKLLLLDGPTCSLRMMMFPSSEATVLQSDVLSGGRRSLVFCPWQELLVCDAHDSKNDGAKPEYTG